MKRHKYGFILIEWMVQFLLLTTVALISYNLIASWHRTIVQMNRVCNRLLPIYIATDIMRTDIHEATKVNVDGNAMLLSITSEHRSITWYCKEKRLFRSIKSYDQKDQRWLNPYYGLFAQHIVDCKTHISRSSKGLDLIEVDLKIENRSDKIGLNSPLRNGVII